LFGPQNKHGNLERSYHAHNTLDFSLPTLGGSSLISTAEVNVLPGSCGFISAMSKKDTDARLRDIVLDPIGSSLKATNAVDDCRPFQDPGKEDIYSLYDARTLDVWEDHNGASTRLEEHPLSRKLPARLFEPDSPRASKIETLVFRLLVSHPAMDANQEAWHDDLSEAGKKQINYLPFDPEAIQELITRYCLPEHWMYLRMQAREVGNFHRETSWDFTKKEPVATRLGR
jgi:hypothetical protein